MSGPWAKVIADSIFDDWRVSTLEASIHRFVLAELNTHRLISRPEADAPFFMEEFSRNSASSRAIPVQKQLDRVHLDPALPVVWPSEQKGMQGGEELVDRDLDMARVAWKQGRSNAIIAATAAHQAGLHKSVTNRLIEPFMWHRVVITATNWEGFFSQRLDENAQPEIRAAAEAMKHALDHSTPSPINFGMWHLPYISDEDIRAVEQYLLDDPTLVGPSKQSVTRTLVAVSTARCARTSYLTHDGKRDIAEDIALYERLCAASPVHYSPAEHPCTPAPQNERTTIIHPQFGGESYSYTGPVYGNLTGYHQHRFDLMAKAA